MHPSDTPHTCQPDPTEHALAVLGARVLMDVVAGETPPPSCWGDGLKGLIHAWQDRDGEWQSDYATPAVAAAVARLCAEGGMA